MVKQEAFRDILCYGKEKELAKLIQAIETVNKLKELLKLELGEEI